VRYSQTTRTPGRHHDRLRANSGSAYETAFGAYGNPSLQLFAALADLAEVLQETGSPDYEAVFLRAHEVDDAIQDEPDPNDAITEGGSDEKKTMLDLPAL
jgi:hypothetical protein